MALKEMLREKVESTKEIRQLSGFALELLATRASSKARSLAFVALNAPTLKDVLVRERDTQIREEIAQKHPQWSIAIRANRDEDGTERPVKVFTREGNDLAPEIRGNARKLLGLSDVEHFDMGLLNIFRESADGQWVNGTGDITRRDGSPSGVYATFHVPIEGEAYITPLDVTRIAQADAYLAQEGYIKAPISAEAVNV